ncbi:MAG: EAL domain-containing protein [Geminicoccaceae bacterium]|nr:EAL domain-containing protein [Geminicoccaceae bacterium]
MLGRLLRDRLPIVLLAACLAATVTRFHGLEQEEFVGQDLLRRISTSPTFENVAIIALDEHSLAELGQWPWSRAVHAEIVRCLARAGARSIGINVVFAEMSKTDPVGDMELVTAVANAGNVALATLPQAGNDKSGPFAEVLPFSGLADVAAALGDAQIATDTDMRVRRMIKSSLAHAVFGIAGGTADFPPNFVPILPRINGLNDLEIISAASLLNGTIDPRILNDRMVIVSESAEGLVNKVWLGNYNRPELVSVGFVQSAMLATLDEHRMLWMPRSAATFSAVLTVAALLPFIIAGPTLAVILLAPALAFAIAALALVALQLVLPVVVPASIALFCIATVASFGVLKRYRRSTRAAHRAHRALEAISDAVITVTTDGRIVYANHAAVDLLGLPDENLASLDLGSVLPASELGDDRDLTLCDSQGRQRTFRSRCRELESKESTGTVIALTDVTADRKLVDEISHRALRDSLTGLANRQAIEQHLAKTVARIGTRNPGCAVAILDLDRFKAINDALGHTAGDHVIFELCYRLDDACLDGDRLGRTGGDELTLVLCNVSSREQVLNRLTHYRSIVTRPIVVHGEELHLRASIGVAIYPDDGETADELLRHADSALQRAKEIGGNDLVFSQRASPIDGRERLWLERELRRALEEDQLEIHYQPRFEIGTSRLTALEALVRWRHPQRGLVPPGAFITFAEETGLICELGRQVLRKSCLELTGRNDAAETLRLSVNVSVVQLRCDPGFVEFVEAVLNETGLPPERLEIEVTESLFLDPALAEVGRQLEALARLRIQLSIDDFGTGYSSLAYLNRFPFSRIKIDRSFVNRLDDDPDSQAIVSAIVGLGQSLAKSTTAEGVEQEGQLALLAKLGCHEVQGFLLGRPQPLSDFTSLR